MNGDKSKSSNRFECKVVRRKGDSIEIEFESELGTTTIRMFERSAAELVKKMADALMEQSFEDDQYGQDRIEQEEEQRKHYAKLKCAKVEVETGIPHCVVYSPMSDDEPGLFFVVPNEDVDAGDIVI